jgi:ArsR family transcriptional regulator
MNPPFSWEPDGRSGMALHEAIDPKTGSEEQSAAVTISPSQRLAILKALADPRRLEIMERLSACQGPGMCSDMRECLPISAATLSHHLKELEHAGLISVTREGKFAHLAIRRDIWQAFLTGLHQI